MAKRQKTEAAPVAVVEAAPVAEIHPEVAADLVRKNSVVKAMYKARYAYRAKDAGHKRKAAQRSAWDWLAQSIAGECLGARDRLDVDRFLALLEANGVDHSKWTNRNKGWEGRLRMTGRLALQRVVAEAGVLKTPDGEELVAPAEWVAKFQHEEAGGGASHPHPPHNRKVSGFVPHLRDRSPTMPEA